MSIKDQLAAELKQLVGFSGTSPKTIALTGPDQVDIEVDVKSVDSMSCSLEEVRLQVPSLVDAGFDALKQWAENLCQRVTYLLENIGPLELSEQSGQVLIRSTPPDQGSLKSGFYEILLQSHADGNFSLRRFIADKNTPGRKQVDIQVTHEVLEKLVNDLVETIPDVA